MFFLPLVTDQALHILRSFLSVGLHASSNKDFADLRQSSPLTFCYVMQFPLQIRWKSKTNLLILISHCG